MKLNRMEKLVVNSPFRASFIKHISLPYLLKQANLPAEPSCLEIGCGIGSCAVEVHRRLNCKYYVALDYDREQVRIARRRFGHLSGLGFIEGSAAAIPAGNCCYDVVFNMGILHHVEQWRVAIKEIYRILKPGGVFLFEDIFRPLIDNFLFRFQYNHPEKGKFHDYEFLDALAEAGFTSTKHYQIIRHYIIGAARKSG